MQHQDKTLASRSLVWTSLSINSPTACFLDYEMISVYNLKVNFISFNNKKPLEVHLGKQGWFLQINLLSLKNNENDFFLIILFWEWFQ